MKENKSDKSSSFDVYSHCSGGSGGIGRIECIEFSRLPPPGHMTEGEYKAWCDMYEIKENK